MGFQINASLDSLKTERKLDVGFRETPNTNGSVRNRSVAIGVIYDFGFGIYDLQDNNENRNSSFQNSHSFQTILFSADHIVRSFKAFMLFALGLMISDLHVDSDNRHSKIPDPRL